MDLVSAALIARTRAVHIVPAGGRGTSGAGLLGGAKAFHVEGGDTDKVVLILESGENTYLLL